MSSTAEPDVAALYRRLLDAWNARDAAAYASLFAANGHVVGFDGSEMDGAPEIESAIGGIFADHATAAYVAKVRSVQLLADEVAILRAVAGLVRRDEADLDPALNAVQTLVATKQEGDWLIAFFQNTPAQFHGRPDLSEALTDELRQLL